MDQQLKNIIDKLAASASEHALTLIARYIVENNYTRGGIKALVKWVVDQYHLNNDGVTQRLFNLISEENVVYIVGLDVKKI